MLLIALEWLLGLFFLVSGFLKVIGHSHMVEEFERFQYPLWLMRLAGIIELIAAPGLLLSPWLPWWTLVGSTLLCGVMVGAAYTNFVKRPPVFGWGTVVILLLCLVVVMGHFYLLQPWLSLG